MVQVRPEPQKESTIQIVRSVAEDATTLVRKEVELARQEMTEALAARVKAIAAMTTAAIAGLFLLAFLSVAGATALDLVLPAWAAWLIVAGAYALVVGLALAIAMRRIHTPPLKPEETIRTVKEDAEWAKAQLKR